MRPLEHRFMATTFRRVCRLSAGAMDGRPISVLSVASNFRGLPKSYLPRTNWRTSLKI